jgi:hypothetical protein
MLVLLKWSKEAVAAIAGTFAFMGVYVIFESDWNDNTFDSLRYGVPFSVVALTLIFSVISEKRSGKTR